MLRTTAANTTTTTKAVTTTSATTENKRSLGDVDSNGILDAVDASRVLAFYAHTSTGGKLSLEEFMKK